MGPRCSWTSAVRAARGRWSNRGMMQPVKGAPDHCCRILVMMGRWSSTMMWGCRWYHLDLGLDEAVT